MEHFELDLNQICELNNLNVCVWLKGISTNIYCNSISLRVDIVYCWFNNYLISAIAKEEIQSIWISIKKD